MFRYNSVSREPVIRLLHGAFSGALYVYWAVAIEHTVQRTIVSFSLLDAQLILHDDVGAI